MKLKISKNDFVICIFFFLISFCKGIGLGNNSLVYFCIYFIGLLIASIKLLNIGFYKNQLINIIIISSIGLLDYIIGEESTILFTAITLAFLKDTECAKIIRALFWGRLLGFLVMIILPCIGVIDMNSMVFYRASKGGFINRYSFGYDHPNYTHSTFNLIVIMYIYLYFDKLNIKKILMLETLNFILYCFTYSRTGFIIMTLFLVIAILTKKNNRLRILMPQILNKVFIVAILISFILAIGYEKIPVLSKIDELLTGRIKYMSILIKNFNPPVIKYYEYKNILFDNGYFDLLYNGGIIAFLWFCIMQIKTNLIIKKKNMYKEALLTNILFLYCITESYYASSIMNISILFFSLYIFKDYNDNNVHN